MLWSYKTVSELRWMRLSIDETGSMMLLHHVGKEQHRLSAFQRPAAFLYHLSSRIPQTLDGGRGRLKQ